MTSYSKDGPHNVLVVEWEEKDSKFAGVLHLGVKALLNVAASPVEGLSGRALFEALQERGAVPGDAMEADGTVVPAVEAISLRTGRRTYRAHYLAGRLQDPARGTPAVEEFDAVSGNRTRLAQYLAGRLHDAGASAPAVQIFDAASGNRTRIDHYQAGRLQDPETGEPAVQVFEAQTGMVIAASRYAAGRLVAALSRQELVELAAQKGLKVAVPEAVARLVRPELRPVM